MNGHSLLATACGARFNLLKPFGWPRLRSNIVIHITEIHRSPTQ